MGKGLPRFQDLDGLLGGLRGFPNQPAVYVELPVPVVVVCRSVGRLEEYLRVRGWVGEVRDLEWVCRVVDPVVFADRGGGLVFI